MNTDQHTDEEKVREHIQLTTGAKRQTKRSLRDQRSVVVHQTKTTERNVRCSHCGEQPSRPIAPPGLWLCRPKYFEAVQKQLTDRKVRLFLDQNDVAFYKTAYDMLGMWGRSDDGAEIEGARLFTENQGEIWYGDINLYQVEQLERKLGVAITYHGTLRVQQEEVA